MPSASAPVRFTACIALALLIAACGGGGGGGGGGSSNPSSSATPATQAPVSNALAISVDPGPANGINLPFVSVTVCAPGAPASCQSVDHVLVDTASVGLRLVASVLPASLSLPQQTAGGAPIAECAHFADGVSWGSIRIADLQMAGEQAANIPVQIIDDPAFPAASMPAACSGAGKLKQTPTTIGANGILGVGVFRQDCGLGCEQNSARGIYYSCPAASGCVSTALALASQVQNPVAAFATDNNGVVVQLPAIPAQGSPPPVSGSLLFGLGTQSNNVLGAAQVYGVDRLGLFSTIYKGLNYSSSFIDSGSNGLFFQDASIPLCSTQGFYCPPQLLNLSAVIQGTNGANASISFSVANANALFAANPTYAVFNDIAASAAATVFDWGLPFFFGRSVFVAIEGASTPKGTGPYFAF